MISLVRASSKCKRVLDGFDKEAKTGWCEAERTDQEGVITRTFSEEDARRAKLLGKSGPWSQYPERMMQLRARGFALRDAFADVLSGLISGEEAEDIAYHKEERQVKDVNHSSSTFDNLISFED